MRWRACSVNKASNALYVDSQNLPASFIQLTWLESDSPMMQYFHYILTLASRGVHWHLAIRGLAVGSLTMKPPGWGFARTIR
ncbi:hypothetical protein GFV06_14020 [Salmonella enterica]|nr:hypothetical protein [Salmonella enterica]